MGGFGRWTALNNLNVAVGDSRLIGEAHPRESLQEVPGSELHLNFKGAHRATLEAIPDPGPVCRNRHYCRYQKWKGQGRFARSPCRPAPREWWSALDSQLRRDCSGTEGSSRGRSKRREEVGSSYSPWLNNRIDWECATGVRLQSRPNQGPAEAICILRVNCWQSPVEPSGANENGSSSLLAQQEAHGTRARDEDAKGRQASKPAAPKQERQSQMVSDAKWLFCWRAPRDSNS
jgi:hypothetical protein